MLAIYQRIFPPDKVAALIAAEAQREADEANLNRAEAPPREIVRREVTANGTVIER